MHYASENLVPLTALECLEDLSVLKKADHYTGIKQLILAFQNPRNDGIPP